MAQPIYIPDHVKQVILNHISEAVSKAVVAYPSAAEDEDALTGQLGFALRKRETLADGWTWSIDYTKFRGRGLGAAEKVLGADGILEMRVHTIEGEQRKAALFQSKKEWKSDSKLLQQALLLSNWREAAFVLNFTSNTIETFDIDDIVRSGGMRSRVTTSQSFTEFIANTFFPCVIGNPDLLYDRQRRILTWRADTGERIGVPFVVRSLIRVNVNELQPLPRLIKAEEVRDNRMFAAPTDILGVSATPTARDIKKAKQKLALTYHPDKFHDLEALYREIANRRMQEVNAAADKVRSKDRS